MKAQWSVAVTFGTEHIVIEERAADPVDALIDALADFGKRTARRLEDITRVELVRV